MQDLPTHSPTIDDMRVNNIYSFVVIDIYVAKSPSAFIVTYNPEENEHVISIDQSDAALNDPTISTGHRLSARYNHFVCHGENSKLLL